MLRPDIQAQVAQPQTGHPMSNRISEIRPRSNVLVQTRRPQTELSSSGITISGRTSRARADHLREGITFASFKQNHVQVDVWAQTGEAQLL